MDVDAVEILWREASVYSRRFAKSAAALIAVQRMLVSDPVPGAEEFLALVEFVSRADAEHFTQVWRDPSSYYWVRRAVHFLAVRRGAPLGSIERAYCSFFATSSPLDALRLLLTDFKRFALSLAMLTRQSLTFEEPYEASLPLAIPGAGLILNGEGNALIHGTAAGQLDLSHRANRRYVPINSASALSGDVRIETCTTASAGDVSVAMNPALFRLPGLEISANWNALLPLEFQAQNANVVSEAMALVEDLQPSTFSHFSHALHAIALKPMREGNFSSFSSSELPGAFVCSVPCDRYELAATLIHEFHHNRLFFIEETGSFFEDTRDAVEAENHYSPWRDGPRPLHGILHALYVYLPVFRFWSAAVRGHHLSSEQRAFATDQLTRIPIQLRIGANQISRYAKLTSFGSMLFDQMKKEVGEAESEAVSLGTSLNAPAISARANGALKPVLGPNGYAVTIGETLLNHFEKSDRRGECIDERSLLARGLTPAEYSR